MKTLRIFISSPGDVRLERVRAFEVIGRLQTKFRAFLKLEPILWEHDAQRGWATFQANILPPSKTDIVLCILWARIGMRLPEDYKRADGSVPTGTEWEFEDAYAGYKLNGTPDLYVYRKTANPTIEVTSEESLEEWRGQKRASTFFLSAGSAIMTGPSKRGSTPSRAMTSSGECSSSTSKR
jgi:eukaryotic-like serine/threonine-protein kinase